MSKGVDIWLVRKKALTMSDNTALESAALGVVYNGGESALEERLPLLGG